jgi:coenzyme PQQ synthesis protein D (PqqD)
MSRVPTLSVDAVVVRSSEPITREVDGELVMLDPRQSVYFALDSIGHRVWLLLEQPQQVDALCRTLVEEFDVSLETCRTDVLALLEQLSDAGLVSIG